MKQELKTRLLEALDVVDSWLSGWWLPLSPEKGRLITVLFHGIFRDEHEVAQHEVLPGQQVTVAAFDHFVRHFVEAGYTFVSPESIAGGLDPKGKFVMITFDDGYQSHRLALPVLRKYQVPAVCFVSPAFVKDQKCFWWDVLYRECYRRGMDLDAIDNRMETLKKKSHVEIAELIRSEYGSGCMNPRGDVDRPLTVEELREFATDPLISIGNHTLNHEILTHCSREEAAVQIEGAQTLLKEWLGESPIAFSYPNGNVPEYSESLMRELNYPVVLGLQPKMNRLGTQPSFSSDFETLHRHTLWGNRDLDAQLVRMRSDFRIREKTLGMRPSINRK